MSTVNLNPPEKEMELGQLIARGEEADRLLNGELAVEVRNEVKLRIIEGWAETPPEDVAIREKMHATFNALDMVEGVLRDIINDGHHAAAIRDQRQKALDG